MPLDTSYLHLQITSADLFAPSSSTRILYSEYRELNTLPPTLRLVLCRNVFVFAATSRTETRLEK